MEREFVPKKTSHFEISHVYPCRYTYWKHRHNLDYSGCERLHRRLIFKPLKSEKGRYLVCVYGMVSCVVRKSLKQI